MSNNRECTIDSCGKPRYARGFCRAHYSRMLRHGDPLAGVAPNGKPLEFFHNVVLPYDGDECLIWPFARSGAGYAQLRQDGRTQYVSRLVCEHKHGPAPTPEHEAAHECGKGNMGCVSPNCLYWATSKENSADMIIHGTRPRGERHGCAKLTEAEVHSIRQMSGIHREIAAKFGVAPITIDRIKSGKTWRHIGELEDDIAANADARRTV